MIWALFMGAVLSAPVLNFPSTVHHALASRSDGLMFRPREPGDEGYGETTSSRTVYTVVSMFCISLLAGMVGYRVRQTDRHQLKSSSLTHILIYLLYFFSALFVLSAAVIESGLGLASFRVCRGAIILCLAFYVGSKVIMYLFLVERAHALRAPYVRRTRDWLWVIGTLTIAVVFGTIAVAGFVWPIANISKKDGRCRIGLPQYVTIPLLSFDVLINILLTLVFVFLLSPLIRSGSHSTAAFPASRFTKCLGSLWRRPRPSHSLDLRPANQVRAKKIERLLWRTFIGSCLVLIPTVGNMASLTSLKGRELGWVCLTICTFDVTWTVGVLHWLTVGSSDEEGASIILIPDTPFTSDMSSEPVSTDDTRCGRCKMVVTDSGTTSTTSNVACRVSM
ncbi:hypothetical protein BKA66DRAFT_574439 [Pyrenochaeta sp. MPI-SDFR-AT-0127]|nr:hypothetical protein BKA66DRAFT_574439 [Pyrenochaeta sp. MPI-SDFR-AT-0127]